MQAEFVLSTWKKEELSTVKFKLEKAVEVIEQFAAIGIEQTMTTVNNAVYNWYFL